MSGEFPPPSTLAKLRAGIKRRCIASHRPPLTLQAAAGREINRRLPAPAELKLIILSKSAAHIAMRLTRLVVASATPIKQRPSPL